MMTELEPVELDVTDFLHGNLANGGGIRRPMLLCQCSIYSCSSFANISD